MQGSSVGCLLTAHDNQERPRLPLTTQHSQAMTFAVLQSILTLSETFEAQMTLFVRQ